MISSTPLRALPRVFLPGTDFSGPFELPSDEADKLRKVLRMSTGDPFAALPNDGSLWRCRLEGKSGVPEERFWPDTEPKLRVNLAQALPKTDRLETVLRMGTEIGVAEFVLFPAERSVVKWDADKLEGKLHRMRSLIREAAEQSFRTRLPELRIARSLAAVLEGQAQAIVLAEQEDITKSLWQAVQPQLSTGSVTLVIGPEGGWAPREVAQIGDRGVTLGPLVLRTDTAGPAAAAIVLFGAYAAMRKNSDSK